MKLIIEITSKLKVKETENSNKDEIRTIIMENKISLDANSNIHRRDYNSNQDTLTEIQNIFIIIREFKTHIRRHGIIKNSKIIQD